jgi:CxxC motif-containing protein (DUF1111 family)
LAALPVHLRSLRFPAFAALACALSASWLPAADVDAVPDTALTAGPFTTAESGPGSFMVPVPTLTPAQAAAFAEGHHQFNEPWVVAPDPSGVWGLGPTFNEDRCSQCHERNGRARAPRERELAVRGMLVRLSVPGQTAEGGPLPHPVYGDQLQNRGMAGAVPPEGQAIFAYGEREVRFADGETIRLRVPRITFMQLAFGPLGDQTMTSPRIAPAMVGLGLLEAVPEATLLDIAKRQAVDGISGRPNRVWDVERGATVIGRFGWKANQPTLRQQVAAAFHGDIGATTFLFPDENCPPAQKACRELPAAIQCSGLGACKGDAFVPEVIPSRLDNITFYMHALAVPVRRNVNDPEVLKGAKLFDQAKCSVCHVPQLQTAPIDGLSTAGVTIRPYTDLLLHDMGDDLADHRPDFQADGREWRTPPLWGIGLLRTVNGHTDLLHDGRARNVVEAILWHGGEAATAREMFRSMRKAERDALVRFVESL